MFADTVLSHDVVVAAIITALPTVALIVIKWQSDRKRSLAHQKWMEDNVGRANGQGTLIEMTERSLQWQGEHEARDRRVFEFLGVPEDLL